MRFSFGKIWAAAVCLLVFASCAKDTSESYAGIEQRSLDAWMKLHRPELLGNRQEARGFSYYVDVLDAGSTDKADTLIAETDCWVQYEFTARDLNGNVCMTRNAVQAKQQGTFTRYTYYSPYFRYSGSDYTTLLEGSYYALREPLTLSEEYIAEHPDRGLKNGMQARRGTELMLYLPSSLAYSSSGASSDAGYGGQYELDANRPAILHIKVTGRVSNPLAYEGETVDAFVEDNGTVCPVEEEEDKDDPKLASVRRSLRDAETDEPELPDTSVDPYKYTWYQAVDTVPQLYISHVFSPGREPATTYNWKNTYSVPYFPYNESMAALDKKINDVLVERFGAGTYKGDSIKSGETASIWYIGRFLDGYRRSEEAHLRRGAERRQRLPVRSSRRGRHVDVGDDLCVVLQHSAVALRTVGYDRHHVEFRLRRFGQERRIVDLGRIFVEQLPRLLQLLQLLQLL